MLREPTAPTGYRMSPSFRSHHVQYLRRLGSWPSSPGAGRASPPAASAATCCVAADAPGDASLPGSVVAAGAASGASTACVRAGLMSAMLPAQAIVRGATDDWFGKTVAGLATESLRDANATMDDSRSDAADSVCDRPGSGPQASLKPCPVAARPCNVVCSTAPASAIAIRGARASPVWRHPTGKGTLV